MGINKKGYKVIEPLDDAIKINKPGKVRSVLQLLFEREYLSLEALLDNHKIELEFLTKILDIERSFFEKYKTNITKDFSVSDLIFKVE